MFIVLQTNVPEVLQVLVPWCERTVDELEEKEDLDPIIKHGLVYMKVSVRLEKIVVLHNRENSAETDSERFYRTFFPTEVVVLTPIRMLRTAHFLFSSIQKKYLHLQVDTFRDQWRQVLQVYNVERVLRGVIVGVNSHLFQGRPDFSCETLSGLEAILQRIRGFISQHKYG